MLFLKKRKSELYWQHLNQRVLSVGDHLSSYERLRICIRDFRIISWVRRMELAKRIMYNLECRECLYAYLVIEATTKPSKAANAPCLLYKYSKKKLAECTSFN